MVEAIEVHREGTLAGIPAETYTRALYDLAKTRKLSALVTALEQRYPEL